MTPLARRDAAVLAALLLLGVGLPLAMLAVAGGVGIPSNDDWVYVRGADSLYRSGVVSMPGHTAATVGQLVLVQPLLWLSGGATWAFTAFGLGTAAIGVASTYLLARCFVGRRPAVVATLLLVAFPGFEREAATFMTDVPTLALELLSLLLGAAWLRFGRRSALWASLAVGVLGVSIREFAVAAPAAVLVVSWARAPRADRPLLVAATLIAGAAVVAVLQLVGSAAVHGGIGLSDEPVRLYVVGPAMATVAAGLLPVLVPAVGRRLGGLRPLPVVFGVAVTALAFAIPSIPPLVGQLWMAEGLVGNALLMGQRAPVIPSPIWTLSLALAVASLALLATLAARWLLRVLDGVRSVGDMSRRILAVLRSEDGLLLVFATGYALELAILVSLGAYPLDRYLWPLVAALGIVLVRDVANRRAPRWSVGLGSAALLWLGVSALAIAANSFAYDTARWRAGEAAVADGYAPQTVDAGYEWVGYHSSGAVDQAAPDDRLTWYAQMFMPAPPCAIVSNDANPPSDFRPIGITPQTYPRFLLIGPPEPLYTYGSYGPACRK